MMRPCPSVQSSFQTHTHTHTRLLRYLLRPAACDRPQSPPPVVDGLAPAEVRSLACDLPSSAMVDRVTAEHLWDHS
eukprot:5556913-Amphidinium_carterae.1